MSDTATTGSANGGQAASTVTAAATTTASASAPAWHESAAPELRAYISNKGWSDPFKAVESYQHLEKMVGVDRIEAPKSDWKPEKWNEFYGKLGRPESPDKYKLPEVKLPEGMALNPQKVEAYKKMLHESGLSQAQVEKVWSGYLADVGNDFQAQQTSKTAESQKAMDALKQEWGVKYEANLHAAQTFLKKYGSEPLIAELEKTGTGNNPELIKMMSALAFKTAEDSAMGGGGGEFLAGSAAAVAEISRLKMDKDFMSAFLNNNVPGHKEAVQKWQLLHQNAYPDPKAA